MIQYGLACLLVCVLSLADRRALPFAVVILSGWMIGYVTGFHPDGWRLWPLISATSAVALTYFWHRDPDWRWKAIAALAGTMLFLDVLYLGLRWQRVPVELQYSRALDFCLLAQLALVGYRGGINVGNSLWSRMRGRLDRGPLAGHATRKAETEA